MSSRKTSTRSRFWTRETGPDEMAAAAPSFDTNAPHIPVLIGAIIDAVAPVEGHWIDGTLGAGGYTRALLDAGASRASPRSGLGSGIR